MNFETYRTDTADGPRIAAVGHLDLVTGPRFEEEILRAEDERPVTLTLDFSGLEFMDSTGLGILLDADVRAATAGRRLVVIAGDGEALRVFEAAGVADRLSVARIG